VELREESVPRPGDTQVTIEAIGSLVSRGTEMLAYRGELQPDMDLGLETAAGSATFPIKYGYQVVGRVVAAGGESGFEEGEIVFTRHPHQTLFTMTALNGYVRKLPDEVSVADGLFVNLAEVALGALHDVPVRFGDVVVVFGLGVVGSIAALLAQQAAGTGLVVGVDPIPGRRDMAHDLGVRVAVSPEEAPNLVMGNTAGRGADVVIEASGNPGVIQDAIEVCGREGTIAVVSFYGARRAESGFNDRFHFLRQRIVSCQVGRVGSGLEPRWDRARRFETSALICSHFGVSRLLSHEARISEAADAYRLLDQRPDEVTALAFTYDSGSLSGSTRSVSTPEIDGA
jgi:alcohol dehydrogenase